MKLKIRAIVMVLAGLGLLACGGCESSDSNLSASDVIWLDADVSGWPQTAKLTASIKGGTLILDSDKARVWPAAVARAKDGSPLYGNCWLIAKVDGTWYGATFDWMKVGATTRPTSAVRGTGGHVTRAPLNTYVPRSGERIGFMVSTPARTGERTVNERSNISWLTWP